MKISWKRYFEPTPKRFRVLGDSLAAGSLFVAGLSIMTGHEKIAIGVAVAGWLGKFISNFFSDEDTPSNPNSL
jgi:hypothetical protein